MVMVWLEAGQGEVREPLPPSPKPPQLEPPPPPPGGLRPGARQISNSGRHASFGKPPGFSGGSKFSVLGTKETPPFFFVRKR